MRFSVSPTNVVKTKRASACELIAMQEAINNAWMNLNAVQKEDAEIQQIVDNVNFSLNAISKYGEASIKILNADGSLENLLGIPEKLITIEKVQEGLGDAANTAWTKFKEGVKKVIEWIRGLIKSIMDKFKELFNRLPSYENAYKEGLKTGKEAYKKEFIASTIAKGHYILLNGVMDNDLKHLGKLIDDLCLFADCMYGEKDDVPQAISLKEKFDNTQIFDDLENGRFFLKSEGDSSLDTWAKCKYSDPDQIFTEIEKAQAFLKMALTLKTKCIDVIENALAQDMGNGDAQTKYADVIQNMRQVVGYAKKVMSFATVMLRVTESTLTAAGITNNELKKKFNVPEK